MKKSISILLTAVLILSVLTACSGKQKDNEQLLQPNQTEDVVNTNEDSKDGETETKDQQGKYTLEEAEKHENAYITEKYSYEGIFSPPTPYDKPLPKEKYILRLPQLKLDSESAKQINKRICDEFEERIKLSIGAYENDGEFWDKISWESYLYNDILSLVITRSDYMSLMETYYTYSINVVTGEEVEHDGILKAIGLSEKEFTEKTKAVAQKVYEQQAGYNINQEWYKSDLEKTISDDNINSSVPLFLNDDGILHAIVTIHITGGADYHYEIVKIK